MGVLASTLTASSTVIGRRRDNELACRRRKVGRGGVSSSFTSGLYLLSRKTSYIKHHYYETGARDGAAGCITDKAHLILKLRNSERSELFCFVLENAAGSVG
jgi:hypothetical protein